MKQKKESEEKNYENVNSLHGNFKKTNETFLCLIDEK